MIRGWRVHEREQPPDGRPPATMALVVSARRPEAARRPAPYPRPRRRERTLAAGRDIRRIRRRTAQPGAQPTGISTVRTHAGRMGMIAGLPAKVRALLRDEPVPDWQAPMLATLTAKRFSDPRWIFEPKLDGERCLA